MADSGWRRRLGSLKAAFPVGVVMGTVGAYVLITIVAAPFSGPEAVRRSDRLAATGLPHVL
jgi:hypothetical protein